MLRRSQKYMIIQYYIVFSTEISYMYDANW